MQKSPKQLRSFSFVLRNGQPVVIRPISSNDETKMIEFHQQLSETSVYRRYFHLFPLDQRITHSRLNQICSDTDPLHIVLVAEMENSSTKDKEILGVGRLMKSEQSSVAEFAVIIEDRIQGQGLGRELLKRLVQIGKDIGIGKIFGLILQDNVAMQHVCKKLGFTLSYDFKDQAVRAELILEKTKTHNSK
jgi:acetyltransferase